MSAGKPTGFGSLRIGTFSHIFWAAFTIVSPAGFTPACAWRQATLSLMNLLMAFCDGLVVWTSSGGTENLNAFQKGSLRLWPADGFISFVSKIEQLSSV